MTKTAYFFYGFFTLFALAYAFLTPPGEAPDEMPHLQYVDFVLHERRLPNRLTDHVYQDHHPPLYYTVAALALRLGQALDPRAVLDLPGPFAVHVDLSEPALDRRKLEAGLQHIPPALHAELEAKANLKDRHFRITRGHFLIVRLLSVLLGLATLVCVHRTAALLLPERWRGATIALALAATLPQFQFIAGVINCDIMAIFTGNLLLYLLARGLVGGILLRPGFAIVAGLALALTLLAKMSGIAMVIPVVAAYAYAGRAVGWRAAALPLGVSLGVALVAGGWWYALNAVRYGDPFMTAAQAATMGEQIHQPPLNAHYFAAYFFDTTRSFFGRLGPFRIPIADWSFFVWVGLVGLGLAGILLRWERGRPIPLPPGGGGAFLVLAAGLFATWLVVFRGNLTFYSSQGRYLYPGLAAVSAGLGLGLVEALRPGRLLREVGAAGLVLMSIHPFLFRFLPEYYGLESRIARPLVVRYENLGHPYLDSALVEGGRRNAWGGFGTRLDPDFQVAWGPRVHLRFDRLPAAEALRVRLRFGATAPGASPDSLLLQSLDLGGTKVAGALTVTPEPREEVYAAPGYPGPTNSLDLVLQPVPGFGRAATASEVWIERFPVCPRGLVLHSGSRVRGGAPISVELTLENIHPSESVGCLVGLDLVTAHETHGLGQPTRLDLDPGELRTIRLKARAPDSIPAGRHRLRAGLALASAGPFVDINPCFSTPSVGRIEPHPRAFGRFRIRSQAVAERGNPDSGDPADGDVALRAKLPVPPAPPGRFRVRVDAWFGRETRGLEVRVLTQDGRRVARIHRSLENPAEHDPGDRVALEAAYEWPGGPGQIVLVGKGDVSVDRIRVDPVWVPGINLIAFPHEPAVDVR